MLYYTKWKHFPRQQKDAVTGNAINPGVAATNPTAPRDRRRERLKRVNLKVNPSRIANLKEHCEGCREKPPTLTAKEQRGSCAPCGTVHNIP